MTVLVDFLVIAAISLWVLPLVLRIRIVSINRPSIFRPGAYLTSLNILIKKENFNYLDDRLFYRVIVGFTV